MEQRIIVTADDKMTFGDRVIERLEKGYRVAPGTMFAASLQRTPESSVEQNFPSLPRFTHFYFVEMVKET